MTPLFSVLPPLLLLPFIIVFGERYKNLREAAILMTGVLLLVINIVIYQQFTDGKIVATDSFLLFSGLSLKLSAEPLGVLFALLASFLWIVTTVYSIGYMPAHNEKHQTRFYSCFAIAIAAVMGAAYADNLLTLFIAYEVITLSTFPLVTHSGTDEAKRAGRIYLGVLMGASIGLLLPAIIAVWWLTGTTDFKAGGISGLAGLDSLWAMLLLLLIVLGTAKAALMPCHFWLPNAMVAPTPVSALLHAVAVVKTGVFLIVKVVVYIFGLSFMQDTGIAMPLIIIAAITILLASLIALRKENLKARLAYSTVSQLAYIVLAALLANQVAINGAGLHIISHAFGKITLFFCAGAIMVTAHKKRVSDMRGMGKQMPFTMAAFFIAAISIVGLPPLAGLWSKLLISQGAISNAQLWLVAVLMLSSLLTIAYLLPIPLQAFFSKEDKAQVSPTTDIHEAPLPCLFAIAITVSACIVFFVFPDSAISLLDAIDYGQ